MAASGVVLPARGGPGVAVHGRSDPRSFIRSASVSTLPILAVNGGRSDRVFVDPRCHFGTAFSFSGLVMGLNVRAPTPAAHARGGAEVILSSAFTIHYIGTGAGRKAVQTCETNSGCNEPRHTA